MYAPQEPRDTPECCTRAEDPLVAALRLENEHLRDRNHHLSLQLEAAHAAQAELAAVVRLTAPLRRVQELARQRKQERRRRQASLYPTQQPVPAPAALSPAKNALSSASTAPHPVPRVSDSQAERFPLLARTRAWSNGLRIDGPRMQPIQSGCSGRVLVIAHVFYPEIWPDLARRLNRIPVPFDLVVTLVEGHSAGLLDRIVAEFPGVTIETLPNRGRDMWPLVHVVELGLVGRDYDAVLKVHTKRSVHRIDGAAWRDRLLDALCPSPEGIRLMLELLQRDPSIGMIAPAGAVLGQEFWGGNATLVEALAARARIGLDPAQVWFPGGSMFWSRPQPLNLLREARLTADDFEHDVVVLDSTTAHALERFLGALVSASGMVVIGTDEVAGRVAQARVISSSVIAASPASRSPVA